MRDFLGTLGDQLTGAVIFGALAMVWGDICWPQIFGLAGCGALVFLFRGYCKD